MQQLIDAAPLFNAVIAIASCAIAILGYMLTQQRDNESRLSIFRDLHEKFWTDEAMQQVRSWLACASSYASIQPILEKRRKIDEKLVSKVDLTPEEYEVLEKLDRFLNFLQRIEAVSPAFKNDSKLWEALNFGYWLRQVAKPSRQDLAWYLHRFYPKLFRKLREEAKSVERFNNLPGAD